MTASSSSALGAEDHKSEMAIKRDLLRSPSFLRCLRDTVIPAAGMMNGAAALNDRRAED